MIEISKMCEISKMNELVEMIKINTRLNACIIFKSYFLSLLLGGLLINTEALAESQISISNQNTIPSTGSSMNASGSKTSADSTKNSTENIAESMASTPERIVDSNTNVIENNIPTSNLNNKNTLLLQRDPYIRRVQQGKQEQEPQLPLKPQQAEENSETLDPILDPQDATLEQANNASDAKDVKDAKQLKQLKQPEEKNNVENSIKGKQKKQTIKESKDAKKIKEKESIDTSDTPNSKAYLPLPVKKPINEITFADNEEIKITFSNRDINRLSVFDDKIQSINGPGGIYTAKNDIAGSAYIGLNTDTTFTLFAVTVKGHVLSLLITPRSIAGRAILLIPTTPPRSPTRYEAEDGYQKALVTLISSMINNESLSGYVYSPVKKPRGYNFSNIVMIKPVGYYLGSRLLGTISEIRNRTNHPITLKPSVFYSEGVRAIALSEESLAPKASGLLYQTRALNR